MQQEAFPSPEHTLACVMCALKVSWTSLLPWGYFCRGRVSQGKVWLIVSSSVFGHFSYCIYDLLLCMSECILYFFLLETKVLKLSLSYKKYFKISLLIWHNLLNHVSLPVGPHGFDTQNQPDAFKLVGLHFNASPRLHHTGKHAIEFSLDQSRHSGWKQAL